MEKASKLTSTAKAELDELLNVPELDDESIKNDVVVSKYKFAGNICNIALRKIIEACKEGASVRTLCQLGDKTILDETAKIYKKEKELKKGIAYPTCVSVNYIVCNFSPLPNDEDQLVKKGDLVKIELGAHIDGYIAKAGHSIVVGALAAHGGEIVKGKAADVIKGTWTALQVALRTLVPGTKDGKVSESVQKAAGEFGLKPVQNSTSSRMVRHTLETPHSIILNPTDEIRRERREHDIVDNAVYHLSIFLSTGEGKCRESDLRCTIYRRGEENYNLKMRTSRQFFAEADNKHGNMAFSLASFADEKTARLGVKECVTHKVINRYPVLEENKDQLVAQFETTVLLMPTGLHQISGLPLDFGGMVVQSSRSVHDAKLKEILSKGTKKSNKKKKSGAKAAAEATDAAKQALEAMEISDKAAKN